MEFEPDLPCWHYILDGHTPVRANGLMHWAAWYETADCRVAQDFVGGVEVSTVFLSIDHNFLHGQPPVLFETMVFGGGELNEAQFRYSTWAEAEAGHQDVVEALQTFAYQMRRYDALRMHDRYLRFPKPKRAPFWRPIEHDLLGSKPHGRE